MAASLCKHQALMVRGVGDGEERDLYLTLTCDSDSMQDRCPAESSTAVGIVCADARLYGTNVL